MSATLNLCAGGPLMIAVLKKLIGGREVFWDRFGMKRIMGTMGYAGRV